MYTQFGKSKKEETEDDFEQKKSATRKKITEINNIISENLKKLKDSKQKNEALLIKIQNLKKLVEDMERVLEQFDNSYTEVKGTEEKVDPIEELFKDDTQQIDEKEEKDFEQESEEDFCNKLQNNLNEAKAMREERKEFFNTLEFDPFKKIISILEKIVQPFLNKSQQKESSKKSKKP